jgi:sugar-specific transcriptional regulator TrmB
MELTGAFSQLGLSANHLKLYLYLLEKGKATVLQLSQDTALPRTSCYDLLTELLAAGLISETFQQKTRFIRPESPRKIINMLESRINSLSADYNLVLENSKKLETLFLKGAREPKVKYLTGSQAVKAALGKVLDAKGELLAENLTAELNNGLDINQKFYPEFLKKMQQESIECRELLNYSSRNYNYKQVHQSSRHKIFLQRLNLEKPSDITRFIWEDNIVQIDFARKIVVQYKDSDFTRTAADYFNYLWELLEKQSGIS